VVNEFKGETFECDPGAPTSCITTGEQELVNLSFEVSRRLHRLISVSHTNDAVVFQKGSITISLVALAALTVGFAVLGYIALLLNRERYCVLQATQRATVNKSEFPRHVVQYDDHDAYSMKPVEPRSFDDDLLVVSEEKGRDESKRTGGDELHTIQV